MVGTNREDDRSTFGPFEVCEIVGSGGMGTIYRAFRLGPGGFRKEVALKLIHNQSTGDIAHLREFLFNEGCVAARFKHPNIVEVFEVGEIDGIPYLSMEYIHGPNLSSIIKHGGPLPLPAVLDLGIQLCGGLRHAHRLIVDGTPSPFIHGDVKPTNIVVSSEGQVCLVDLGIARPLGTVSGGDGGLLGTLPYMSPSLLAGLPTGPWVDLYGVGAVLFEAAVGHRFWKKQALAQLFPQLGVSANTSRMESRLEVLAEISEPLAQVVSDMLLADGNAGLRSAREAVERLKSVEGVLASPDVLGERALETFQSKESVPLVPDLDSLHEHTTEGDVWPKPRLPAPEVSGPCREVSVSCSTVHEVDVLNQVQLEIGSVELLTGLLSDSDGQPTGVRLSPIETRLLAFFAMHPNEVLSRAVLLGEVWEYHPKTESRTVYTTINRLRSKIERDPQSPTHLIAIPRRGYCFRPLKYGSVDDSTSGMPETREISQSNIPEQHDVFLGRSAELERANGVLECGSLVTLKGTGGIGKTRLALELGRSNKGCWAGGVWFCSLANAHSREGFLHLVGSALGVGLGNTSSDEIPVYLGNAIAARGEILIVLDNLEQVTDSVSDVIQIWRKVAPMACLLVTSRESLRLGGEVVIELEPLAKADAVELLIQRATPVLSSADLEPSPLLEEIVSQLDCLPLAIELVAGRLELLSTEEVLGHFEQRFSLLQSRQRDVISRHGALHATIDWSWKLLSPGEKAALAQLSVFVGGWDYAAAAAVVDLNSLEEECFLPEIIKGLLDKSLLTMRAVNGSPRLNMFLSIRSFAAAQLKIMEEGSTWGESRTDFRHVQYQARRGSPTMMQALNLRGGGERRAALVLALPDVIAAYHTARSEGDEEKAAGCAIAAVEVFLTRGPMEQGLRLAEETLTSKSLTTETRGRLLYIQSELLRQSGRQHEAEICLMEVRGLAREGGDELMAASADASMAMIKKRLGDTLVARMLLVSSIKTAQAHGDHRLVGLFQSRLGMLEALQGRTAEARVALQTALSASRRAGDQWTEGVALHTLGHCETVDGNLELARQRCAEALTSYQAVQSLRSESEVLGTLGIIACTEGDLESGRTHFQHAIALCKRVGHSVAQGVYLGTLGELERKDNQHEKAKDAFERGEALLRRSGESMELAKLLCKRGRMMAEMGHFEEAQEVLDEVLAITVDFDLTDETELGQLVARLGASVAEQ